jgi:hypothetical protein
VFNQTVKLRFYELCLLIGGTSLHFLKLNLTPTCVVSRAALTRTTVPYSKGFVPVITCVFAGRFTQDGVETYGTEMIRPSTLCPRTFNPRMIRPRMLYPAVFTSPYVSSLKCGTIFRVRLG